MVSQLFQPKSAKGSFSSLSSRSGHPVTILLTSQPPSPLLIWWGCAWHPIAKLTAKDATAIRKRLIHIWGRASMESLFFVHRTEHIIIFCAPSCAQKGVALCSKVWSALIGRSELPRINYTIHLTDLRLPKRYRKWQEILFI